MYLLIILIVIIILVLRSYTESFISSIPTLNNSKNLIDTINLNAKINFMYTKHDGVYKFFRDKYIVTNNINDRPKLIRELFNNNVNSVKSVESVESGFYNYKYNYLGLLYKNNIYKLNLFTQTLMPPIFVKDYFNGLENTNINCLFYLEQNIYIFSDNTIVVYSLNENKIINTSECTKIFDNLQSYPPECCFLNYNDMEINNSVPYIYILKNELYYRYVFNIDTGKFTFVDTINNLKNNTIINTSKKHKISLDGVYRITCIGGGIESGGKGGLIINDITLNKNDILKIVVGKKGNRLPVKSNMFNMNTLNNLPNLSITGSCSGAGATSLYKDKELLMIAGGGGGWSSEIINAPNICNSVAYESQNKHKPNLFFPIKKIVIFSPNDKEKRYKIKVNKFDVKVVGLEELLLDIIEYPKIKYKKTSLAKYETQLSNFNEKASIEINFNEPICDYKIDLDFEVISSDFDSQSNNNKRFKDHINSKVVFYDEQNRSYTISNFNDNFTSAIISSETLLNYFSNNNLPDTEYNNDLVKNGASKNKYNEDSDFVTKSNRLFYLDNAYKICGGGFATTNKFNSLNTCGGGGGYKGGKSISLSEDYNYKNIGFPIDYVAGCGGSSYISHLSSSKNKEQFINNYNVGDGLVIITKLNKSI
jgi:hypothetical protein